MGGYTVADPQADLHARPHGRVRFAAGLRPGRGGRRPGHGDDVPVVGSRARRAPQWGPPFFAPRWRGDEVGMVLDDDVDWDEVAELVTESYCILAPKKLVEMVDRPTD
jgi:hypothetical protein